MRTPRRPKSLRPLLVATAGITLLGLGACGGTTTGNLLPPTCPDGGTDLTKCQEVSPDAGTDGGTRDGGP
ncbi:MAG: hypothetical protein Q8L14_26365 [Myxococcales bacterium]|nr:hypothetical protein [Myxococcales bacterium]